MADINGIVSSQDLANLRDGVNVALTALGTDSSTVYQKIAFVDDGSATGGNILGKVQGMFDNGDGTTGEVVRYPFSPVSNAPSLWPFGEPRGEVDEVIQYLQVTRTRQGIPDTRLYWDTQDVWGILNNKAAEIMKRAGLLWDFMLAAKINGNGTCYDGVSFFNSAHPCDPNDSTKGTYSNDVSIAALDATGFAALLDAYAAIKWFDGKPRNQEMRKPIVLCPNKSLELAVRQLVFGSLIPFAGTRNDVGGSSPFNGMVEDVLFMPTLLTESAGANANKYIYLVSPGTPVKAAFIVSPKRQPIFHLSGIDPNEEIRRKHGATAYGWDAFGGADLGLPQDCVRGKVG